eukprot:2940619-Pyramimonas_sp.AAC.1
MTSGTLKFKGLHERDDTQWLITKDVSTNSAATGGTLSYKTNLAMSPGQPTAVDDVATQHLGVHW